MSRYSATLEIFGSTVFFVWKPTKENQTEVHGHVLQISRLQWLFCKGEMNMEKEHSGRIVFVSKKQPKLPKQEAT